MHVKKSRRVFRILSQMQYHLGGNDNREFVLDSVDIAKGKIFSSALIRKGTPLFLVAWRPLLPMCIIVGGDIYRVVKMSEAKGDAYQKARRRLNSGVTALFPECGDLISRVASVAVYYRPIQYANSL